MSDSSPPVPSLYADAPYTAQRLAVRQNGYAPVPVTGPTVTCDKPGKAVLLRDWCSICASADEGIIRSWQHAHPYWSNTGILCGSGPVKMCAVDCDIRVGEVSESVAVLAARKFGITPLQRIGLPPKILLVYQVETPFAKKLTPKYEMSDGTEAQVEILCMGQQFVAFGIHPDTGQPYRWLTGTPETVCAADLPVLREQDVAAFLAEAEAILIDHGGKLLVRERAPLPATGITDATARPRATNDELIDRIKADSGWHDNMLMLTARLVCDGRTDGDILALASELTTERYTVEETEDDMREMIDGAREKGFDRGAPMKYDEANPPFAPLPDPGDRLPAVQESRGPACNELLAPTALQRRHRAIAEAFRFPTDCRNMRCDYLVKHVLATGNVSVLVGQPGAGKSILAPHVGYGVAQGREVFGLRVKQGRVLYVTAEDEVGMARRVYALSLRYGDAPEFAMCSYESLMHDSSFEELRDHVAEWKPKLVIIDTLAAAWTGIDELSFPHMGRVYMQAKALAAFGCAVLVIHHPPKKDDKGLRGAGNLNGSADVTLTLEKKGDMVFCGFGKNRNGTSDRTLAFRIGVMTLESTMTAIQLPRPSPTKCLRAGFWHEWRPSWARSGKCLRC